ncbi:MAG TPA: ABC transporter permease, partial [Blastocatellia bacterium]
DLIGRSITLDNQSYEVCGIMPAGFRFASFPKETDVWMPFGLDPFRDRKYARGANSLGVIARLKSDVSTAQAQSELDTVASSMAARYEEFLKGWNLRIVALSEQAARNLRPALLVLFVAVAFVLLIACANVANLQLARATAREKEIAIRAALGASRWHIARQLLIENSLLALIGGGAGLILSLWAIDLMALIPYNTPNLFTPYQVRPDQIGIDGRVLAFAFALSSMTGIIFGLAPAMRASKVDLNESLKEGGVKSSGEARSRARSLLVIVEMALAVLLLAGAGLMVKSFSRLQRVDPGFDAENVLTMEINLSRSKYEGSRIADFYTRLLERASAIAGVRSVGAVEYLPLSGLDGDTGIFIEGRGAPPSEQRERAHFRSITPKYFSAIGAVIRSGREFTQSDNKDATRVAIINETMARRCFPGENPIGKRMALDFETMKFYPDRAPSFDLAMGMREIVGVVADIKHVKLEEEAAPEMYLPFLQRPVGDMTLVVRTDGDPLSLAQAMRGEVLAIDEDQPVAAINTMSSVVSASLAQPRFNFLLLTIFAAIALLLAGVGVYGVMSYSVSQRTREIGIRSALGAQKRDVLRLVLGKAVRLILAGAGAGLIAAFALTRLMSKLLYGVSATDPLTFASVALMLAGVALIACYIPARRAAKVDPIIALRYE